MQYANMKKEILCYTIIFFWNCCLCLCLQGDSERKTTLKKAFPQIVWKFENIFIPKWKTTFIQIVRKSLFPNTLICLDLKHRTIFRCSLHAHKFKQMLLTRAYFGTQIISSLLIRYGINKNTYENWRSFDIACFKPRDEHFTNVCV